jgi:hypothetical protein
MRKILLLLMSGLLIAFMAGSAMAYGGSTVVDENDNLIPVDSVDVAPGTTTTIYFHADPTDPYFREDYYELQLSVSGEGITAEVPEGKFPMPHLKASTVSGKDTETGKINNVKHTRWFSTWYTWEKWTPTSTLYPIEITRSSGSSGDGQVTVTF